MGLNKFPSGSTTYVGDYKIVGSTGDLWSNNAPVYYYETGSTATNLKPYGISLLSQGTTGTGTNKYTIDAPMIGVTKTVTVGAVTDSSEAPAIYTGSTAIFINANSTANNLYATLTTPYASVTLMGLTTALWGVVATHGTVNFTTST